MIDISALKTELLTDPLGVGYGPSVGAGSDGATADLINAKTGPGAANVKREPITPDVFFTAIPATEFLALTPLALQQLSVVLSQPTIDLTDQNTRDIVQGIFPTTAVKTALGGFKNRVGSRAEKLFGTGTVVSIDNVATALRGK